MDRDLELLAIPTPTPDIAAEVPRVGFEFDGMATVDRSGVSAALIPPDFPDLSD